MFIEICWNCTTTITMVACLTLILLGERRFARMYAGTKNALTFQGNWNVAWEMYVCIELTNQNFVIRMIRLFLVRSKPFYNVRILPGDCLYIWRKSVSLLKKSETLFEISWLNSMKCIQWTFVNNLECCFSRILPSYTNIWGFIAMCIAFLLRCDMIHRLCVFFSSSFASSKDAMSTWYYTFHHK